MVSKQGIKETKGLLLMVKLIVLLLAGFPVIQLKLEFRLQLTTSLFVGI